MEAASVEHKEEKLLFTSAHVSLAKKLTYIFCANKIEKWKLRFRSFFLLSDHLICVGRVNVSHT